MAELSPCWLLSAILPLKLECLVFFVMLIYFMLNHGAANFTNSQRKLEDIERQLKGKLQRAREITAAALFDDFNDKTQEELMHDLEKMDLPCFDPSLNYSNQYWQTYLQNEINCALICKANERKAELKELIGQIENLQDQHFRMNRLKSRKKNRRMASEISKSYLCPYQKCQRLYGSDVSLNLHIKIKHNGGNKTDREKLAEKICMAEENNEALPPLTLNLPPGYLREYRNLYFQNDARRMDSALEQAQNGANYEQPSQS